jgi:hypothetical protein
MTRRLFALAILTLCTVTCGSSSPSTPSTPSTPSAQTFTLSGTVTVSGSVSTPISGATVTILDGPSAGQSKTTDATGKYSFEGLTQAGFTTRAAAAGFTTANKPVTLTASTVLDFALVALPAAILTPTGGLSPVLQPDGSYAATASGVNNGNACASNIAGTTTLSDGNGQTILTMRWTLPTSTTVRPGESFTYSACCGTQTQMLSAKTYFTAFTFTSAGC